MTYKIFLYYGIKSTAITYIIFLDINYHINAIIINKKIILKTINHNINLIIKIKQIFMFMGQLYRLFVYVPFILSRTKKIYNKIMN